MSDISITASGVLPGSSASIIQQFLAGAEVTAGKAVYLDNSSVWQMIDADLPTGTENTRTFGVTMNHAYAGQPVAVNIRDSNIAIGGTVVAGTTYCASTTLGGICPRADLGSGDYVVNLGVATTTGALNLNPTATGTPI